MKKFQKITSILALSLLMFGFSVLPFSPAVEQVGAQNSLLCDVFPFLGEISFASGLCGDEDAAGNAVSSGVELAQFAVSLVFVAIIGISIFVIIKAALKYIQSEGDETKVEEATKAIKNVFIGIGALIIGIIGLVIVLGFFNATGAVETEDAPKQINNLLTGGGT